MLKSLSGTSCAATKEALLFLSSDDKLANRPMVLDGESLMCSADLGSFAFGLGFGRWVSALDGFASIPSALRSPLLVALSFAFPFFLFAVLSSELTISTISSSSSTIGSSGSKSVSDIALLETIYRPDTILLTHSGCRACECFVHLRLVE